MIESLIPEVWSKALLNKFYDATVLSTFYPSPGRPTTMQRLRWRVRDLKTRIVTAWKILRGELDPNSFEDY